MLAIKAVNLELKVERRWDQLREWHAVGMTQPWKQGTKERTVENKIGSGLEGPGLENIPSTGKITWHSVMTNICIPIYTIAIGLFF